GELARGLPRPAPPTPSHNGGAVGRTKSDTPRLTECRRRDSSPPPGPRAVTHSGYLAPLPKHCAFAVGRLASRVSSAASGNPEWTPASKTHTAKPAIVAPWTPPAVRT